VIDSLIQVREKVRKTVPELPAEIAAAELDGRDVVLVTGHRRESFGTGFENICHAIRTVA
jgi:UDP-N-acetylglucosamine 2-epimerase